MFAVVGVAAYRLGAADDVGATPASLQVSGSETMRGLVAACAESYMARTPQADIVVRGGSSGDGIAALLHGIVDMAMTSRGLSQAERDFAASRGVELTESAIALDGIAVVVHRSNPVEALDFGQLRAAFSGQAERWRDLGRVLGRDPESAPGHELGGTDGLLAAVARAPGSGTASLFAERVLGAGSEIVAARTHATNEAVVADVAAQPGAIGFTSLGALRTARGRVRTVAVGNEAGSALPTPDAVRLGTYPLARPLYLVGAAPPSDTARAFVAHCNGPLGQALVERSGFVTAAPPRP